MTSLVLGIDLFKKAIASLQYLHGIMWYFYTYWYLFSNDIVDGFIHKANFGIKVLPLPVSSCVPVCPAVYQSRVCPHTNLWPINSKFHYVLFLKGWMTHLHLGGVWVVGVCMWGVWGWGWGWGGWGAPPYWSKQTKGISVLNSDFIRWPIQLWKPTHLYYQNKFNRSLHLNARVVSTHWGHVKMDAIF